MIRPYVTVLKDSFHEAFVSRVLWILLILATIALLLLAPLSMTARRSTELSWVEGVANWPLLLGQLAEQEAAEQPSPGKHIMSLAGEEFRELVREKAGENDQRIRPEDLGLMLSELNSILQRPDFYDRQSFADVPQTEEVEELLKRKPAELADDELLFLNRQLLWAAYPVAVTPVPNEIMQITWAGHKWFDLPGNREIAETMIRVIITGVLNFFLGTMGVFIAILVTASLIPQTFEAGAADLLLSKPVARPLLYLTKFFGGCAFIVLLSTYILAGLWLLLGLRFQMWETSVLKCIGVFLFLFVIYYTVSAAAGLYWKNTIVAVSLSIVFWLVLFLLNLAREMFNTYNLTPREIVSIYPTDDAMLATSGEGNLTRWTGQEWQPVLPLGLNAPGNPAGLTSAFDPKSEELFSIQQPVLRGFMARAEASPRLKRAAFENGAWSVADGPALPPAVEAIFLDPQGNLLLVASSGVYQLDQTGREKLARGEFQDAGLVIPMLGQRQPAAPPSPFKLISPAGQLTLLQPFAAAMHPETGDLAVFSTDTLTVLKRGDNGEYQLGGQWTDDAGKISPARLAWAGETLLLAQHKGQIRLFDPATLEVRQTFTAVKNGVPARADGSPDGKWFAVLYGDESLSVFDAAGENKTTLDGDVSSFRFTGDGLLVADRQDRLTTYEPGTWQTRDILAPDLGWGRIINSYLVYPLYTLLPKPAQLDQVVLHLMMDEESVPAAGAGFEEELQQARGQIDIWTPILTSLGFIVVMLGLTCWYVHRMDI